MSKVPSQKVRILPGNFARAYYTSAGVHTVLSVVGGAAARPLPPGLIIPSLLEVMRRAPVLDDAEPLFAGWASLDSGGPQRRIGYPGGDR